MNPFLRLIKEKLGESLYVQVWQHRLKVSVVNSNKVFDEKPLVAIAESETGKKTIKEIGNRSELATGRNIQVVNPFLHPRCLLADFQVAEKLMQHAFSSLHKNTLIKASPTVVVHPMEKIEGGLTEIEKRAFTELMVGAGAREVFLHVGKPLTIPSSDYQALVSGMEKLL